MGGERARVRAARSVRGAVGVARAADLLERVAVEEDVDEPVAVAAGDDDGLRSEAVERAGEVLGLRLGVAAGEHAGLGEVGRDDGREREQLLHERRAGRVVEQHRAGLGDHHRVDHDGRAGLQQAERRP